MASATLDAPWAFTSIYLALPRIVSTLLAAGVLLWAIPSAVRLAANYVKAKYTIGLPLVLLPACENDLLYKLTLPLHESIIKFLRLDRWMYWELFYLEWQLKTRYDQFKKRGTDLFVITTPGGNVITIADAGVAWQVVSSRTDFPKPVFLYDRANYMGRNVVSCEGAAWKRFRKIISPPFNEGLMATVWDTTRSHAQELQCQWTCGDRHAPSLDKGSFALALNVILAAGFGVYVPLCPAAKSSPEEPIEPDNDEYFTSTTPPPGYRFSFRDAIHNLLTNVLIIAVLPGWILELGPTSWVEARRALDDSREYIRTLVRRERARSKPSTTSYRGSRCRAQNLLTSLIDPSTPKEYQLTEAEAISNMNILSLAGQETTAGVINYSIAILATFPDKQQWMLSQLDAALREQPDDPNAWNYGELFPRLAALLCVMNETMRLFPPIPVLPKWTAGRHTVLHYDGRTYHVPPKTVINISIPAIHQHPKYWGEEAYEFHPQKWYHGNEEAWTAESKAQQMDKNTPPPFRNIRKPIQGSFMPFSEGRRACVGKKFAQVEFALALAVFFQHHRVELKLRPRETFDQAQNRAWDTMRKSVSWITLRMQEEIEVEWVKR